MAALAAVGGGACSQGDGRTLDPPIFPPPATTLPTASVPGTEPAVEVVEQPVTPLQLVTPWRDGAPIPARHTCDGEDLSPALSWSNVPTETVELAVTVSDLDAPDYVHWVVTAIPPSTTGIAEGGVPSGATLWPNGSGREDYAGPCPPAGEEHRYLVTVHALNQQLEPADEMSATEIIEILNLTSIDQSSVSGTFVRAG